MKLTGMDAGAKGWLVMQAQRHYWRVADYMEFDDLLQEGIYIWYRVAREYEGYTGRVQTRARLMQAYKRSLLNYFNHLSNIATRAKNEILAEDVIPDGPAISMPNEIWDHLGQQRNVAEYELMVAEAPRAIRYVLRKLFEEGRAPGWASQYRIYPDGTRETLNSKLCRLVGVDPERIDIATPLRSYLSR